MDPMTNNIVTLPGSKVELFLEKGFDIWLHSYFVTGLVQLAREGTISLALMRRHDQVRCLAIQQEDYPLLLLKCTAPHHARPRLVCFDPRDQSDVWQKKALDECDLYFKRSTHPPDTAKLTPSQQSKVRPINPMFATWYPHAEGWTARMYWAFVRSALLQITKGQPLRDALNTCLRSCHNFASLSSVELYEDTPHGEKRPQVLFQTRLWDPSEEKGSWVDQCNRERVEMVRVLRTRLGNRCVGGLIRTPYAEKHYPDLLSNLTPTSKAKRPEFIRLCRQFLIRVNIKALFDAIPYSLGETLAANNCLVSETIRNSFATPLIADKHYLVFSTPNECADRCLELLDSPAKAQRLREEAHTYYRAAVCPKEAMRTYLTQALA